MKLALVGGAYKERFSKANAQTCINFYSHMFTQPESPDLAESEGYLKPTPGLVSVVDSGGTRVRSIYSQNDLCFYVISNVLYKLDGNNVTTIGTMTNFLKSDSLRVYMALNGNNQLGIFGGPTAYVYDLDADTLTQITDVDFPGAESLEYIDGYGLVTYNGRVYFCNLNDFTTWTGADVFTPTYEADKTLVVKKLRGTIWCFGKSTIEPYYNTGTTPFERTPQASKDIGLMAKDSVAAYEDGIFFLGTSQRGAVGVYLIDTQQTLSLVSPGSINALISANPQALATAYGVVEQSIDSHAFYHLSIPDLGKTYTFDYITKMWHERSSIAPYPKADGSAIHGHWRANCSTNYRGDTLVGDYYSGSILRVEQGVFTEKGTRIRRERTLGPKSQSNTRMVIRELVLSLDYTPTTEITSPQIMVSFSTDGGHHFHETQQLYLQDAGMHGGRLRIKNLGSSYSYVIKLEVTDPVDITLINLQMRGSVGVR